jgi:hypothetical protein
VDEFIKIVRTHSSEGIEITRNYFLENLTKNLIEINALGLGIEKNTGLKYLGLDASLAPYPNGESSVALLVEMLGNEDFGSNGSLFFTAYLTDIVKESVLQSGARSVGFNGVMYSVLEDDYLALRNKQKNLTLDGLLMYSAVCGCGIDMVPVAGDILEEEIASIILDVAGLSVALKKPLGVRLLPINGGLNNEVTKFNHDFLVDTRIFEIKNRGVDKRKFHSAHLNFLRDAKISWE